MFYYRRLELITSVHIRCWKCRLFAAVIQRENNKELTIPRVLLWPTFVLVYTVLRRDVACRIVCSRLRTGDQIWRLFIGSGPLYKPSFLS